MPRKFTVRFPVYANHLQSFHITAISKKTHEKSSVFGEAAKLDFTSIIETIPEEEKNWYSRRLDAEGWPEYLKQYQIPLIWQFKNRKISDDQAFALFTRYALPEITSHLEEGDPKTQLFVKWLSTGKKLSL